MRPGGAGSTRISGVTSRGARHAAPTPRRARRARRAPSETQSARRISVSRSRAARGTGRAPAPWGRARTARSARPSCETPRRADPRPSIAGMPSAAARARVAAAADERRLFATRARGRARTPRTRRKGARSPPCARAGPARCRLAARCACPAPSPPRLRAARRIAQDELLAVGARPEAQVDLRLGAVGHGVLAVPAGDSPDVHRDAAVVVGQALDRVDEAGDRPRSRSRRPRARCPRAPRGRGAIAVIAPVPLRRVMIASAARPASKTRHALDPLIAAAMTPWPSGEPTSSSPTTTTRTGTTASSPPVAASAGARTRRRRARPSCRARPARGRCASSAR